jgi:hypothetical protein
MCLLRMAIGLSFLPWVQRYLSENTSAEPADAGAGDATAP